MENQPKIKTSKEIIAYLATQFPECFTTEGDAKPLKVGIFQDIASRLAEDANLSKVKLRSALRTYTMSWRYLYSIKEGSKRVDLDGNECEAITAEHVEHAQQQLKEAKDKVKAQRLAERKAAAGSEKNTSERTPVKAKKTSKPSVAKDKKMKPKSTKANVTNAQSKPEEVKTYLPADLSTLKVGDEVKVRVSSKPIQATLIAVEKDNIRVKIPSGMELTVKPEHIVA